MSSYPVIQEKTENDRFSDWIHPQEGYRFACCDCGLVHDAEFLAVRVKEETETMIQWEEAGSGFAVLWRIRRNNRATAAHRREKRKKKPVSDTV
jgi:hypothetical protein